jgi:hypothetical protein
MIISAIFGRDKVGQTVKDLVIGVERFFTGKKVETVGGAAQKKPPPPEPPRAVWTTANPDHRDSKPATKTAVAGVDVDSNAGNCRHGQPCDEPRGPGFSRRSRGRSLAHGSENNSI